MTCSATTTVERYSTGLFARVPRDALPGVEIRTLIDRTLEFDFTPARFSGALYVLVDGHTGSASELVTAVLADSGAARVLGQRTVGAGCGYTNGGVPAKLKHSGLEVRMPDCVRLRADGTNEVEGIAPHVAIEWANDSAGRAAQLVEAVAAERKRDASRHVDATVR